MSCRGLSIGEYNFESKRTRNMEIMGNDKLALSYDLGTQSMRVIIFDDKGNIVALEKTIYEEPCFSVEPGFAEQTPEFYWNNLVALTKKTKKNHPELWDRIGAISVTTLRDVVTCLDKDNKPLRPFILYLDQRKVCNLEENFSKEKISALKFIGLWDLCSKQYASSYCNWIKKYEPEVWEKTEKFIMLSAYLNYKLLGELCDTIASQVGHIPFDYKKKEWQSETAMTNFIFEAKKDKMVDKLFKSCETMGTVSKEVAQETGLPEGVPIIASGADKACETLAVGCEGKDVAAISLGTAVSLEVTTDKYVEPANFLPAYPSVYNDKFNPEVLIFRGMWMISWFKKEFGKEERLQAEKLGCIPEDILNKEMMKIPLGCDGLVLQPYWSPSVSHPLAKGSIMGFSDFHTRIHIYRAIIEGIGFALYDAKIGMEKRTGHNIKRVMISGGGSNSEEICQIFADLLGCKVQKVQTNETSALGAAMASFTGIGVFADLHEAVKAMHRIEKCYEPNMENHKLYDEIFRKVYKKIYRQNRLIFRNIRNLQNRCRKTIEK